MLNWMYCIKKCCAGASSHAEGGLHCSAPGVQRAHGSCRLGSLDLSEMSGVILTLQSAGGTGRCTSSATDPRVLFLPSLLWAPSAQQDLSAPSRRPGRLRQGWIVCTAQLMSPRRILCCLLSSWHPCWCLAPVQEAASHPHSAALQAQPALQMPSSSATESGFQSQSPWLFSLGAVLVAFVVNPADNNKKIYNNIYKKINRLVTALSAGGNKADSSGGMWSERARKLRPEASL